MERRCALPRPERRKLCATSVPGSCRLQIVPQIDSSQSVRPGTLKTPRCCPASSPFVTRVSHVVCTVNHYPSPAQSCPIYERMSVAPMDIRDLRFYGLSLPCETWMMYCSRIPKCTPYRAVKQGRHSTLSPIESLTRSRLSMVSQHLPPRCQRRFNPRPGSGSCP